MKPLDIAVLIGSLRKASVTRRVATALIAAAPKTLSCRIVDIGHLQLYNEDLDIQPPTSWTEFRQSAGRAQAVILLTPEYNRSMPACLKNALDVGSRPADKSIWNGKPAAVVSVTPYKLGAFGANHHVRQTLVYLNMPAMQQPEAYIGGAADLFDAQGKLTNEDTRNFLTQFMAAFAQWATTVLQGPSDSFDSFLEQRRRVALAYSNGDAGPLDGIVAESGTATFFGPLGGIVCGAQRVRRRYDEDAQGFSPGAQSKLEVLSSGASGGIGFWTGIQEFNGTMRGHNVAMKLRITEVFLRDGNDWKLIHRHADPKIEADASGRTNE